MNILHVAPLSCYGASGFIFSILGLAKAQLALGHRVGLICSTPPGLSEHEVPAGIILLRGPDKRHLNPWSISQGWLQQIKLVFGRPDVVNFHGTYIPFQIALGRSLKQASIPYVHTSRGDLKKIAQSIKPWKKKVGNCLFARSYLRNAAAVHALTDAEATEIGAFDSKLRIFVSSNGIDDEILSAVPDSAKGGEPGNDPLVIAFIGRLDIYIKGLDLLLTAVRTLQEAAVVKRVKLLVTGPFYTKGDELEFRRLVSLLPFPDEVVLTGPLFGEEKYRVLMGCDVFACTSRSEGMPMAVIEAMAFGKPCMVTPGSNAYEYVIATGSGWYCEESADSIAQVISSIDKRDGELALKGQRARAYVAQNLLWSRVAALNVEKLEQCLAAEAAASDASRGRTPKSSL
jgi:glycosyltransferase involved in cell wall biosynthesis